MALYSEAYFSDLLRMTVRDRDDQIIGRLRDVAVRLGETFPLVTKLVVRLRGRREPLILPWSAVRSLSTESIHLHALLAELQSVEVEPEEIRLGSSVLNREIVDVENHRVVRVHDLKLATVEGQLRLVAVGVGTRSLLRGLRMEGLAQQIWGWFGRHPHEQLISWEDVHAVEPTSHLLRLGVEREKLQRLNPADLADILGVLSAQHRAVVVSSLDDETTAAAMEEMEFEIQKSVLDSVESEKAADILEEIAPDAAADLVGDLPKDRAEELLSLMEPEEASDVKELLKYPDDSVGGLMTPDFVALRLGMSVQQAIEHLRQEGDEPETIFYCYVVDEHERLVGVLSLRDLIVAPPDQTIQSIISTHVVSVHPLDSQERAAELIAHYNLLAVPVIGEKGELLGIVTVDDAIDAVLPTRWKKQLPKVFSR